MKTNNNKEVRIFWNAEDHGGLFTKNHVFT